jgi:hypothetical protein
MSKVIDRKVQIDALEISEYEKSCGVVEKYMYTNLGNGEWFVTCHMDNGEWLTGPTFTQSYISYNMRPAKA